MGLQREIEELYRRVLSADLARIARLAIPSSHAIPTTPPKGMYYLSQEPTAVSGSVRVTLRDTDFVVKRLLLDPLSLDDMAAVRSRRQARGDLPADIPAGSDWADVGSAAGKLTAFHSLQHDLDWTATPLTTRIIDVVDDTPALELQLVLRFAGVDYVRVDGDDEVLGDLTVEDIDMPHGNVVDGWPERIELPPLDGESNAPDGNRVFLRADIAFLE